MKKTRSPEFYRDKVMALTSLKTLPVIATEILKITREDKLSVGQLLPTIKKDPPLAMKVLNLSNSAFYGLKEKVESLRQAIVVIGMAELSHLAVSFSLISVFTKDKNSYQVQWEKFWEHSTACGHIAQLLDKKLGLIVTGSPYSLGLLHDIGKLVLHRIDPELFANSVEYANREKCQSFEAEQELFGVTHADVGQWIAEKWQLPEVITQSIGNHHHPDRVSSPEFSITTALIQMADLICNFREMSFGTDFIHSIPRDEKGWLILTEEYERLEGMDFERFVMSIADELDEIKKMIELIRT